MMKVLVVDDDKLVRKGLISAMPWAEFGMEVVGETSNGEKAIEFLHQHPVDLLLTDLAMPVMSGIELMRYARKEFPQLYIVVLTLHQDFDYIQEALRLGAIDYIAKVQLEKERFEEVLGRIHRRIQEERSRGAAEASAPKDGASDAFAVDVGVALFAKDEGTSPEAAMASFGLPPEAAEEADVGIWFWPVESAVRESVPPSSDAFARGEPGWMALRIEGLRGLRRNAAYRLLRAYRQRGFFYDYHPAEPWIATTVEALQRDVAAAAGPGVSGGGAGAAEGGAGGGVGAVRGAGAGAVRDALAAPAAESADADLKEAWLSMDWIHDEDAFRRLRDDIRRLRPPVAKCMSLLYVIESEWSRLYGAVADKRPTPPDAVSSWVEAEAWLQHVRETTLRITKHAQYGPDIIESVLRAVTLIRESLDQPIVASDVAKRVNMSRSYFSQCFKDIVGTSFHDYIRNARIEKAKELLVHTNKPIQWVAERTGYMDDKYFSRLFRDHAGMLPSEYRQAAKGRQSSED